MRVKTFEKHTLKKWSGRDCVWLALMVAPFAVLFLIVTVIPVLASIVLSFFQYDMINPPQFIGLDNYISIFTQDRDFMQHVLPNTIVYALAVGPGGYLLSFLLGFAGIGLNGWAFFFTVIILQSLLIKTLPRTEA